jgi:putative ABC transport system substrate-binding protein
MRWALLIGLVPSISLAGAPLIVAEMKVPQYREAVTALMHQVPDAVQVDPGQVTAEQVNNASLVVPVGQKAYTQVRSIAPSAVVVFSMVLGATSAMSTASVTGVPLEVDATGVLKLIKAISPKFRRVGVIYDSKTAQLVIDEAQKAAASVGVTIVTKSVASPVEVRDALSSLAGSIDVLWLPADPKLFPKELVSFLLGFAAERNLPLVGFLDAFTQAGALASVSPDYVDIGEQTGRLVAEILARPDGKRLPVPALRYSSGKLTLNKSTAKALGIEVPDAVIAKAKQVY